MDQPGVASPRAPTERKFAVLLFADLSGYTRLCEQLDPEEVVAAVHPVMAALQQAVRDEGGTICSTAGDGFFASFGVPVALEDAAFQAVTAAAQMRHIIGDVNQGNPTVAIPAVHVGITAGEVLVLPTQELAGFSLVGSPVNLASRLCDAAPAGEVYVDDQVHDLVRDRVRWMSPHSLSLRGLDRPVRAWPLERVVTVISQRPAPSTFVGRSDALDRLDQALTSVCETDTSSVIVIGGEPGIGKTRLLAHWREGHPDVVQIELTCTEHRQLPLEELLEHLRVATHGEPSTIVESTRSWDASLVSERPDPWPALLIRARRLLTRLSVRGPVGVIVDDLHLADASLLAFFDDLRRDPLASPVLLVAATRLGEQLSPTPDLILPGLSEDEIAELVQRSWPGLATPDTVRALVQRVNGHPLMTTQMLAYLHEHPDLTELSQLPSSLRMFVAARLDRLPHREKRAIQRLSVCGQQFSSQQADIALGQDDSTVLASLVQRRLLTSTDTSFAFEHSVVHEVAYMSLAHADRAQLHRRHVQLLDDGTEQVSRCHHALRWAEFAAGNATERATAVETALALCLARARQLFTNQTRAAHALLAQATTLIDALPVAAPTASVEVLTLDARCLLEMWEFAQAEAAAGRAADIAERLDLLASIRLDAKTVRAMALSRLRRHHSARAILDDVIATAERSRDDVRRGRALRVLAATWQHESFATLISLCEESHAISAAAGDAEWASATARFLAYLTSTAAAPVHTRWRRVAADAGGDDSWAEAALARADAMRSLYLLDVVQAVTTARRAAKLGDELGALDVLGDALLIMFQSSVLLGSSALADEALHDLNALVNERGNPRLRMFTASSSALWRLRSGRLAACQAQLDEARELAQGFGPGARSEVAYAHALVAADRGDLHDSLAHLGLARQESGGSEAIEELLHRVREARAAVAAGLDVSGNALAQLVDECTDAGGPYLASFARAVQDLHLVTTNSWRGELSRPLPDACLDELAMRADNIALLAEARGADATPAWRESVRAWSRLGLTVWLARAQARSGDATAAQATLDAIGADDEGRRLALQRRA